MIPGKGTSRLRPDLGVVVTEGMLRNAPMHGFIASVMAPYFPVAQQSATFPVIPLKALFNEENVRRASGAGYNRVTEVFESGFYQTDERGIEMPVDERHRAIYAQYLDLEIATSGIAQDKILRAYEMQVAGKLHKAGAFPSATATVAWTDHANADPRKDVLEAIATMRKTGVLPNILQVSWPTYQHLVQCKRVQEAVYAIFPDAMKSGTISITQLSAYLDIEVVVAGAMRNTANKGKAANLADIWTDTQALLCRVAPAGSDIVEPSIARTFLWNEGAGGEIIVEDYYDEPTRASIIRVRHDIDVRMIKSYDDSGNVLSDVSRACGIFITGIKA